jgi:8-oxo-dGTP pyrophosphatase MutT (NUDIX family)
MNFSAKTILVRHDGALILQHRDEKPGITNPGRVTAFGGSGEGKETPRETAWREINEETNLGLDVDDLIFWRRYHKTKAKHDTEGHEYNEYYFVASHIPTKGLEIYEGQGHVVVHNYAEAMKLNMSPLCRQVISDYYHELTKPRLKSKMLTPSKMN